MAASASQVKLFSLNVRGLRTKLKRKSLFCFLKKNKYDIVCLQESHITENVADTWEKEWGGQLLYCAGTSHSLGQVILIRKGVQGKIDLVYKSDRILVITVETSLVTSNLSSS